MARENVVLFFLKKINVMHFSHYKMCKNITYQHLQCLELVSVQHLWVGEGLFGLNHTSE